MSGKITQFVGKVRKGIKIAFIALSHKDEYRHHFLKILVLKGQINTEKDEIIRLYEQMKDENEKIEG
jgi:hypothetical protein